jgi:hypothetical protein
MTTQELLADLIKDTRSILDYYAGISSAQPLYSTEEYLRFLKAGLDETLGNHPRFLTDEGLIFYLCLTCNMVLLRAATDFYIQDENLLAIDENTWLK